jgi:hypothetical protein
MPQPSIFTLAKKAKKSDKEAEKLWKKAKTLGAEELGKKEKSFDDEDWAYVTGIFKNLLGLKESNEIPSFYESKMSFREYMDSYPELYPTEENDYADVSEYELEYYFYDEIDTIETDSVFDDPSSYEDYNEVDNELEMEWGEDDPDMEETMTSGSFSGITPSNPIVPAMDKDDLYEDFSTDKISEISDFLESVKDKKGTFTINNKVYKESKITSVKLNKNDNFVAFNINTPKDQITEAISTLKGRFTVMTDFDEGFSYTGFKNDIKFVVD